MSEYICHFDVQNLEELLDAADALRDNSDDHASDLVLLNPVRFTLFEAVVDGSTVKYVKVNTL